jgi:hypothetical protein
VATQQLTNTPLLPCRHAIQCCAVVPSASWADVWTNVGAEAGTDAWRVRVAGRLNPLRASGHLFKCSSCQPSQIPVADPSLHWDRLNKLLLLTLRCFHSLQGSCWCSTNGAGDSSSSSSWSAVPPCWRASARDGHDAEGPSQVSHL